MKTYLLMAGYSYYPDWGTGDWVKCFQTEDEAIESMDAMKAAGDDYDWYHIVDLNEWMCDDD